MCPRLTQKRELQARMAPLFVRMAVSGYGRARSDPRRSNFALGKPDAVEKPKKVRQLRGDSGWSHDSLRSVAERATRREQEER